MLLNKLRKNLDWVLIIVFVSVVYIGGWQAEVFGFFQRGILATGIFNATVDHEEDKFKSANFNIKLRNINGDQLTLAAFKGKTIFINFWATWCPPCRAEMPSIQALFKKLSESENIVFITISQDEDEARAINYMIKEAQPLPLYFLDAPLPPEYAHQSIPATFVISPDGNIVYQKERMANYDTDAFRVFLENL